MSVKLYLVLCAVMLTLPLAGCGKKGDLMLPPAAQLPGSTP